MKRNKQREEAPPEPAVDILAQNIQSIADLVARREARLSRGQRAIENFTRMLGQPLFLYVNAVFILVWIVWNSLPVERHFDQPPYNWLALVIAVESLILTGTVLITQNRLDSEADRRATLDLQINLISEQKITKILSLLEEFAAHRGMNLGHDPELEAMRETTDPEVMLTAMEFAMEQATKDTNTVAAPDPISETATNVSEAIQDAAEKVAAARQAAEAAA